MKKRILILQNKILHYRKAFYNELSNYYDVTVLHSGKSTLNPDDKYQELVVELKKLGPFYIQSGVLNAIKDEQYDVIISMFDLRWVNNIIAMYVCRCDVKFIWWGAWITKNSIANNIRVYLANKNNPSIFYTHEAKADFEDLGVSSEKLFVANNTIDVGRREKSYKNSVKNKILFVGSLDKRKELDIVISSFYEIVNIIDKSIILTIVGDGFEAENLKKQVQKLELENRVVFKGKITDVDLLRDYYKESLASVSFGQAGLSVLQSFGYGVPFITKSNAISGGEINNIKDGYNGYFCQDSAESFQGSLLKLCTNINLARELGKNAYDYYSDYSSIDNMVQGFRDAIDNTRLSK